MTPSSQSKRTIVAVVPELLVATRIAATAKQIGVDLIVARIDQVVATCRERAADLILVDLEAAGDLERVIRDLKSDPVTSAAPLVCFYPHVRNALRESALAAGADQVLPRSAFFSRLPAILGGERGTPL